MELGAKRYKLLDELRGFCLINMVCYHACWDLVFLFGIRADWYTGWQGHVWQRMICCGFILLSGFCVPLGRRSLKRGAMVFGGGALVTVVTLLFMPGSRVLFGVLTLLGTAMLLTQLCRPWLEKLPPAVGLAGCLLLYALTCRVSSGYFGLGSWRLNLPRGLYANLFTAFLGFPPAGFWSTDYFPLLPWIFLFWEGCFLHWLIGKRRMEPLRRSVCAPLGWLGRNSLVLYLLHQPVVYGTLWIVFWQIRHKPA